MTPRILMGDCREIMRGPFDMIIADPPYGDTALEWDRRVAGWIEVARVALKQTGSMWVFGSMRLFLATGAQFEAAGFRYAQDIVWEKQNGSGFATDRFKRVHEHAAQFYPASSKWADIYNDVQRVSYVGPDKHTRARRSRTPHTGQIGEFEYQDDGTRMMRSVIPMKNMHGRAIHRTEKPAALMEILIRTSCPAGGLVGDFFAGSGAAGEACQMTGRDYVGCEIDPEMARRAQDRLQSVLPFGTAA